MIDYLQAENRVLREQLGSGRLRFTDDQRIRLAAKAKRLGRRVLQQFETIVSPDTLLATGVETVRLPPKSPNVNAFAERFVRSINESCLDRLMLFGEAS